MATQSSILGWELSWTEGSGGLQSMGLQKNWTLLKDFPGGSDGKASAYNVGDLCSISGWGRSPGEGNGNPLLYSCLENPMDRGGCWAIVHGTTRVGHELATSKAGKLRSWHLVPSLYGK